MIKKRERQKKSTAAVGSSKQRVIRQLAKEITIVIILCGLAATMAAFASDFAVEKQKKADKEETVTLQLSGKLQTLQTQIAQLDQALPLTNHIINEQNESRYNLSREQASAVFLKLRDKHVLQQVEVSISSIQNAEGNLDKKQMMAIYSTISISMQAYTDEQVMRYLNDVVKFMPGIITVETFEMSRGNAFSLKDVPALDNQDFNAPKIRASAKLIWHGFRVKPLEGGN